MDKVFYAFGTSNYIRVDAAFSSKWQQSMLEEIEVMCDKIDNMFSVFKQTSEISKINQMAGERAVFVNEVTFQVLKRAQYFSNLSQGAFDATIFPAVQLWGIMNENPKIPSMHKCEAVKKLVNYKQLILDEKEQTAFLLKKGQAIDLGGIVKGYAGDRVRERLMQSGVTSALLNLGGTILTIGNKKDGSSWKVGIQNPLKKRGDIVGSVQLNQDVLVTSGVNERFFIKDGKRYHHILDPRTCEPARTGVLSVTMAGGSGIDLDAMATTMFVLGVEKGIPLALKMGMEALYLLDTGEIYATKGFAEGNYRFDKAGRENT